MPTEYIRKLTSELRTADTAKPLERSQDWRTAKLLADGRKALAMRAAGRSPSDMLMVMGCSRARLYRAMHRALKEDSKPTRKRDPLLD